MEPSDSFNGALAWLLHYGDRQPLCDFIRRNGIQPGIQADALAQLIQDAEFRLGTTKDPADERILQVLKNEWRARKVLGLEGRRDFPKKYLIWWLKEERPKLKGRPLPKSVRDEIERYIQQFKRWRRDG